MADESHLYDPIGPALKLMKRPTQAGKRLQPEPPTNIGTRTPSPQGKGLIYTNNTVVHPVSRQPRRVPSQKHENRPQICSRFGYTGNRSLDINLRHFQQMLAKDADKTATHLQYVGQNFAGGMFDGDGGYLNIPEFKITMFVPPKAIVSQSEPLYVSADGELMNAPLLQDGEQLVSPIIMCGKPGEDTKMGQDVVISFPLYSHFRDDNLYDTIQPMRKDIGNDKQWQILADEIDCLKVVNRNGRCTLMVDRLGCYAIVANCPLTGTFHAGIAKTTVCVGVFAKTYKTQDTVSLVVCFWRDSVATKQRVLGEELKEGLVLLDQTRTISIEPGDKRVFVDLTSIKPGWVTRDQNHERTFQVDTLLRNLDSCSLPSCTFGLDYIATQKCKFPTAQCAIEVNTDNTISHAEPVKFEAVINTDQSSTSTTQNPTNQRRGKETQCNIHCVPGPPPCLTYTALRQIAQYLCQPPKGRHTPDPFVWVIFAKEIGLATSNIREFQERYAIRTPGGALLDFYFGENLADNRKPRDITAKLLSIFKKMKHDEIATILKNALRQCDLSSGTASITSVSKPSRNVKPPKDCSNLSAYEDVRDPSSYPSRGTPSPGLGGKQHTSTSSHPPPTSPKLPPRDYMRSKRPPELPPPNSESNPYLMPKPSCRSPKPIPKSRSTIPKASKTGSQPDISDGTESKQTVNDNPSGLQRRTSFLHGGSAKVEQLLGVGSQSRDSKFSRANKSFILPTTSFSSQDRSRSLPVSTCEDSSNSDGHSNSDSESGKDSSDLDLAKCAMTPAAPIRKENLYIPRPKQHDASSRQSVHDRKKMFEGADSARQNVQAKFSNMSKAAQISGAKMKVAANSVMAQLKDKLSVKSSQSHHQHDERPDITSPKFKEPEKSPFKAPKPLQLDKAREPPECDTRIYDHVPVELYAAKRHQDQVQETEQEDQETEDEFQETDDEFEETQCTVTEDRVQKIENKDQETEYKAQDTEYKVRETEDEVPETATTVATSSLPSMTKTNITYEEPEPQYDTPVSWQRPKNVKAVKNNDYIQTNF